MSDIGFAFAVYLFVFLGFTALRIVDLIAFIVTLPARNE